MPFRGIGKPTSEKGLYFPAETAADTLSAGAERQRRYIAVQRLRENSTE